MLLCVCSICPPESSWNICLANRSTGSQVIFESTIENTHVSWTTRTTVCYLSFVRDPRIWNGFLVALNCSSWLDTRCIELCGEIRSTWRKTGWCSEWLTYTNVGISCSYTSHYTTLLRKFLANKPLYRKIDIKFTFGFVSYCRVLDKLEVYVWDLKYLNQTLPWLGICSRWRTQVCGKLDTTSTRPDVCIWNSDIFLLWLVSMFPRDCVTSIPVRRRRTGRWWKRFHCYLLRDQVQLLIAPK